MTDTSDKPLLRDILPDLCAEIEWRLRFEGEHMVADGIDALRVYSLCPCHDVNCGSFYTGPRPDGGWGPSKRTIELKPSTGMMLVDVVDYIVRHVELINRPEIHAKLRRA